MGQAYSVMAQIQSITCMGCSSNDWAVESQIQGAEGYAQSLIGPTQFVNNGVHTLTEQIQTLIEQIESLIQYSKKAGIIKG
jgi:hypothetical protein